MDLSEFNTIEDAKAYDTTRKQFISANTMNSLLASNGLTRAMKIISETDGHPAQDAMLSFFDPRSTDYNFIQGDPTGDAQIAMLDNLIAAGSALDTQVGQNLVKVADKFAQLKPTLLTLCNFPIFPYANVTLHEFAVAKDDQTRFLEITNQEMIASRYIRITVADVPELEPHNAGVYFEINNIKQRVTSTKLIDGAGDYNVLIPVKPSVVTGVFIDNVYNCITVG